MRRPAILSRRLALATLALAASILGGCKSGAPQITFSIGGGPAALPKFVREIPVSAAIPLEAKAAVVIFVRPTNAGEGVMPAILDDAGRFLGVSAASSHFAAIVPPGEHTFIACADDGAPLRATLAAGKRYYVEVSVERVLIATRVEMRPIRPGSEGWGKLTKWYVEKKRLEADEKAGKAHVGEQAERCIESGRATFAGYDAREAEARSLRPEDGQ